jgi:serine-type D-Ala-D-Ala carboxypeptidase/endopeptidase
VKKIQLRLLAPFAMNICRRGDRALTVVKNLSGGSLPAWNRPWGQDSPHRRPSFAFLKPGLVRKPLILLFAISATLALAQSPARASLPNLQWAETLGADLFQNSGSTGMVIVVVRNNDVFFRGYGETAPNSHQLPSADSVVRLCSLTKIFTTDLLTKLVADGAVRLDDPLQRFAPTRTLVPKRIMPITLADLATHTSGLPRELGSAPRGTPHFTYPDYRTRWRWLPRQQLRSTPGTAALYSNVGYDFLADALQSAAHKSYSTLLAERTLSPMKMYQTTFFPSPAQCARLLIGAHDQGSCASTEANDGSSGLYSTPADMAIWLKYLLGTGGPAIPTQNPAAQQSYILTSSLKNNTGLDHAGRPASIGLGWLHLLPPGDPSHIVEKTGGGAGFTTYIAISQSRHTAIFLAATDGPSESEFNVFKAANNVLLALAGLPPLPSDPPRQSRIHTRKRRTR